MVSIDKIKSIIGTDEIKAKNVLDYRMKLLKVIEGLEDLEKNK